MTKIDFENAIIEYVGMINATLSAYIKKSGKRYDSLKDAMLYSLMAGGKRVRGMMILEFCKANDGDFSRALPFACAIEMIHCYSLIHDDMPCIDNDDMRRGKLSCHKQFDEATALLAGDALLTLAFEAMAEAPCKTPIDAQFNLEAISLLSHHAGMDGMIGGQVMDLLFDGKKRTELELLETDVLKTSAIFTAACCIGCLAARVVDEKIISDVANYATHFGLAFQIVDDILDVEGDEKLLGKPIGSDKENQKTTYVSLLGIDGAKRAAELHTKKAIEFLDTLPKNEFLIEYTKSLLIRNK